MESVIAKDFHWEMGHRLPFHTGGCQNIHGHSYKMRVEIHGKIDSSTGMVMDYFDMKALVQPIVDQLDHSFLCDSSDKLLMDFFALNPMKVNIIDMYSTAENIAYYILQQLIQGFFPFNSVQKLTVRLCETENTYAEAFHEFSR
jgi:6-pyruvoyltetrahydropterin/6-carboxytetrahydropterin synthase